ncbi:MAG: type II/IV secretion system protein [Candidatus Doudnabacteria bacterium]|nr:type II/IV secretion system protein [Candidatus Doudnabacteria bacterium]
MDVKQLNTALKQKKLLSDDKIKVLEKEKLALKTSSTWEDFLLEKKVISEDDLLKLKSEILGIEIVDLRNLQIPQDVLNLVPEPIAHRHKVISFAKTKENLSLAMMDPEDIQTRDFIQKKTGLKIQTFLVGKTSLDAGLSRYHSSLEKEIKHLFTPEGKSVTEGAKAEGESADDSLKKMAEEIPVIRVVDTLLEYAVFEKASDIHIEPQESAVTVRYRIDGVLHDVMTLPKVIQAAIVARVKVLANLKIDEHRLPQDGRFKIDKEGYKFSLRVSTIPIFDGEKVVIRLLDESAKAQSLEDLGFEKSAYDMISRNIKKPHGMLLITGPTGSGKSTTLYTVLSMLNTKNVNISTIEDPVEYRITGTNQMQVSPKIGLTFAIGLRALLRQDPNIIMIGEVRDKETAEEAVHAAMTGHVVFSTLHTNTAAGALPRLLDIGVEAYLIASTVNAVLAQRLVRVICKDCKTQMEIDDATYESLSKLFHLEKLMPVLLKEGVVPAKTKNFKDLVFFKGKGCDKCNNSGYKGRMGIHEILEVTPEIGDMIMQHKSAQEIQEQAEKNGMVLMWEDGFIKAIKGITSVDEILRVSKE